MAEISGRCGFVASLVVILKAGQQVGLYPGLLSVGPDHGLVIVLVLNGDFVVE